MLKLGAWVISPFLLLPLAAQDVLPENVPVTPPVDAITPVPSPELPFGTPTIGTDSVMPKELNITWSGPAEFTQNEGAQLNGPDLKLAGDNGLEVFADRARVDFKTESVTLEGNVSVYQGNSLQRGDRAVYYYKKKILDASGLRASLDPILLESGKFTVEDRGGKKVYVGEDAGITTDDAEHPNFWVRSKKTTIFPNDKIVFNDLKLYVGDTPVFWLPYLSQPLDAELGYHFIPGSRSTWGVFLQNTYGIMLGGDHDETTGATENQWLLSRWHFDLMSRRGVGTGVDLVDTRIENKEEISGLSFYYLNDLDPQINRTGIPRGVVNEDRYKLEFKHRLEFDLPDDASWRLDTNFSKLSDEHFLEDFEPREYRTNPAPDNTLGIYRTDEDSLLSLYGRFRTNDFYRADTRLPEVAYDRARAPLFDLPILHEGSTSFGVIGEKAADPTRNAILNPLLNLTAGDPATKPLLRQLSGFDRQLAERILALPVGDPRREAIRTQLLDASYTRFNTYQELSMPVTLGGFFNITPEAGLGYTRYGAVDGPVDSSDKTLLHFGTETSVKFSKDLGDFRNPQWGLDGLQHIFQPYSLWSVVSTDDFDLEDPQVDRLTPTTRPRPLDPTRFTAVDQLQSWNVVRFGSRNRLLTQRDQQSFEWLFLNTYIDAFINDPEGKRNYSNLYNDVRWEPLPWMGVDFETQFPVVSGGSGFNEFSSRLRFMPTEGFEFSLGYRYLNGHPVMVDSDRFDVQTYTRLNENWGIGTRHILELDDSTLELQQYTIHRDLGNWVAGMGVTHRDNRLEEEYGVIFSLTLKDFPDVSLPLELDTD
ncbi:LPS assembly protein LptD [Luteolibacter yonseiensis]|uniref:LPS assembly protein LptD n=1 Tax=Luteolibacter yonseiensis TaxID=1144680 RepID=A0A934R251_9BACT|nr:LPS assembly protein LptD [Luteolibacter yonseiensis]MBK1814723.1 LPS assembly protein LptD [Luteolibacter yonseiensis]